MSQHSRRLDTDQKALEINLNDRIYGAFAEIGAGQEVARHFFKVGAAAGTIAKSMSAYDKIFSDCIYGEESSGRYVCESRIKTMLEHEYELLVERLRPSRPETTFFVFADTVAAINYSKTIKGHGWLGMKFQLQSHSEANQVLLHVRMHDNDYRQQQDAIGILGVNLVYACYHFQHDIKGFIRSLMDELHERVSIDMVHFSGPDYEAIDNRLITLYLVQQGLTEVAMFGSTGESIHASEFLYRKPLMVVRGNYRPPTVVSMDVFNQGAKRFTSDHSIHPDDLKIMAEVTLQNLTREGDIDEYDFIARADTLCRLGYDTIISNCADHQTLVNYLSDYKISHLALVVGARELQSIINDHTNKSSGENLLVTFGRLFSDNIVVYVYPAYNNEKSILLTSKNLPVHPMIKFLYKHLIDQRYIRDIPEYKAEILDIFPQEVLDDIRHDRPEWQEKVPAGIVELIKKKKYFGLGSLKPADSMQNV